MREQLRNWRVCARPTVTCDAFYRQTFAKEEAWRQAGCVGVDMEASAVLQVARFYGIRAAAALLCSDRHPMREGESVWQWGDPHFWETKRAFIRAIAECALQIAGLEQEKTEG